MPPLFDVRMKILAMAKRKGVVTLFAFVLLLVLFVALELAPSLMPVREKYVPDLNTRQEQAVEIYVATTQELMALATLVIGAAAWLAFNPRDGRALPIVVAGVSGLSIYFGYVSLSALVWMLDSRFFNLDTRLVYWPRQIQFWFFLGSVALVFKAWLTTRRDHDVHHASDGF